MYRRRRISKPLNRKDSRRHDIRFCTNPLTESGACVEFGESEGVEGWYLLEDDIRLLYWYMDRVWSKTVDSVGFVRAVLLDLPSSIMLGDWVVVL